MLGVVRGPNAGNQLQAECIRTLLRQDDTNGDDDKINEAAIQTLLHGGQVFVVGPEQMPDRAALAAVMRYQSAFVKH
jgi:hypothetical protein